MHNMQFGDGKRTFRRLLEYRYNIRYAMCFTLLLAIEYSLDSLHAAKRVHNSIYHNIYANFIDTMRFELFKSILECVASLGMSSVCYMWNRTYVYMCVG